MPNICLHEATGAPLNKVFAVQNLSPEFSLVSMRPITEGGEFPAPPSTRYHKVELIYKSMGISHGGTVCYKYVRSVVLENEPESPACACKTATDSCPIHPWGYSL